MGFKKDIKTDLGAIKVTLAANTQSLETHIKRTEVIEAHVFSWKYKALAYTSVASAGLALIKAAISLFH